MIQSIIGFYPCNSLQRIHDFYHDILGLELCKDQGKCRIYKSKSGGIGFCNHLPRQPSGNIICFVVDSEKQVDDWFEKLNYLGVEILAKPVRKEEFSIYQFFAFDPEGNKIEFQCFLNERSDV